MKIGSKTSLGILSITSMVLVLFVGVQRPQMLDSFKNLQADAAHQDLSRSYEAILTEATALGRQTQDWGSWDDTYNYILDKNPQFETINLKGDFFDTSHIDLVWMLDKSHNVKFGMWKDRDGLKRRFISGVDPRAIALAPFKGRLDRPVAAKGVWGIYNIEGRPMIAFMRPITDSSEKKPPCGVLMMGRFIGPASVKTISKAIGVEFEVVTISDLQRRFSQFSSSGELNTINFTTAPTSNKDILGFRSIVGTDGSAQFGIVSRTTPSILSYGEATVDRSVIYIAVLTGFSAVLGLIIIKIVVTSPLSKLSSEIKLIGDGHRRHLDGELVNRKDEIGDVSRYFQSAFDHLEATKLSLAKSSHEAGMASVAREVLHNAGNVFNSIRVAIAQLHTLASESKLPRLRESVILLDEHKENLAEYISSDPRGSKVVPFLAKLTEHLEQEHQETLKELTDLTSSVAHMGEVIQAQHSFAVQSTGESEVFLAPIVEESVRIARKSLERHGISLELQIDPDLMATCSAPLLLRVLVNLITNAKEAVEFQPLGQRNIDIKLGSNSDGRPYIEISDNGEGIDPSEATLVFSNGFTTKPQGTGYGLHYCANTLGEMGWSIRMHSEGRGKGATFLLTQKLDHRNQEAA